MRTIDKIAKDKKCIQLAKNIVGNNWEDTFNDAIIKINDYELKGKVIDENYIKLFYFVLRNIKLDEYKKTNRTTLISDYNNYNIQDVQEQEEMEEEFEALYIFLHKDYKCEKIKKAQIITELTFYKKRKDIAKEFNTTLTPINYYLSLAKKIIKNEYDLLMADRLCN